MLLGVSVNNAPTVQDAFNTLPAWGYPYTTSSLAPTPGAGPIIGAFAQNTLGLTAYAWINSQFYLEAGGYQSPSAGFLTHAGVDPTDPGAIVGTAPYARIAWQKTLGQSNFTLGGFLMDVSILPGLDQTTGLTDHYTDLGLDASYQLFRSNKDVFTINSRYTHERENLLATQALGGAMNARQTLEDFRIDASYYLRNKVGLTVGAFDTWGSADPVLYAGNANNAPQSSGLLFQVDGTPWGAGGSPLGPRFNMRVGLQYVDYLSFADAGFNNDGSFRRSGDNNSFRAFLWIAY